MGGKSSVLRINAQTGEEMPLEGWYLTVGGVVAYPGGYMHPLEFVGLFSVAEYSLIKEATHVIGEHDLSRHEA